MWNREVGNVEWEHTGLPLQLWGNEVSLTAILGGKDYLVSRAGCLFSVNSLKPNLVGCGIVPY